MVLRGKFAAMAFAVTVCFLVAGARAELIHRYSFSDGAKDSVGKNDGKLEGDNAKVADGKLTLKNDPQPAPDKVSHVSFAAPLLPKGSINGSLVIWFTAKDVQPFARLIDIGDVENGEGRAFFYLTPRNAEDSSRAAITATDVSGRIPLDNPRLDDDKPHCVAVTFDGVARRMHFFIDGKEPQPATDITDTELRTVNPVFNLLGRSLFDIDPGLTAVIDEFRVYNTALNADEVAAIQKAGPDALPAAAPSTQPAR